MAGPSKQLLVLHQRYVRKTLGTATEVRPPLTQLDEAVLPVGSKPPVHIGASHLSGQIADIAFEPRPLHFPGSRPGSTRQASYEAVVGQVLRIHQCYPKETNEELAERLWWAFLTVQCMEMSSIFVHQDRHHFWTSVLRLVITDAHRQKPSSRYADYLNERLNKLLSSAAAPWVAKVDL